jgi:hypothetical protein
VLRILLQCLCKFSKKLHLPSRSITIIPTISSNTVIQGCTPDAEKECQRAISSNKSNNPKSKVIDVIIQANLEADYQACFYLSMIWKTIHPASQWPSPTRLLSLSTVWRRQCVWHHPGRRRLRQELGRIPCCI